MSHSPGFPCDNQREQPQFGMQSNEPPIKRFRTENSAFTEVSTNSQWQSYQLNHYDQQTSPSPKLETLEARVKSLSDTNDQLKKKINDLENKVFHLLAHKDILMPATLFPNTPIIASMEYNPSTTQPYTPSYQSGFVGRTNTPSPQPHLVERTFKPSLIQHLVDRTSAPSPKQQLAKRKFIPSPQQQLVEHAFIPSPQQCFVERIFKPCPQQQLVERTDTPSPHHHLERHSWNPSPQHYLEGRTDTPSPQHYLERRTGILAPSIT